MVAACAVAALATRSVELPDSLLTAAAKNLAQGRSVKKGQSNMNSGAAVVCTTFRDTFSPSDRDLRKTSFSYRLRFQRVGGGGARGVGGAECGSSKPDTSAATQYEAKLGRCYW